MKRAIVVVCAILLSACGGEQYSDLKQELERMTKDLPRKVDPLPVVKPYEPIPYEAANLPDPFGPTKIELVTKTAGTSASKLRPDEKRVKEPLEAFPLDTLKMVGVLQQGKQTYGVVKADTSLYRVRAGNYMGQNFGLITQVTENEIKVRELVQDPGGDWTERTSSLQLQEVTK
jgi:type IV pilus assembly protein PilP